VSTWTAPQTPLAPVPFLALLQAWQVPLQGESQQKPSTHWPLTHIEFLVHGVPMGSSGEQWLVVSQ
jgi:hypothetical protein